MNFVPDKQGDSQWVLTIQLRTHVLTIWIRLHNYSNRKPSGCQASVLHQLTRVWWCGNKWRGHGC